MPLGLEDGFDFPAGIPDEKFVHYISEGSKIVIVSGAGCCPALSAVDGNQPNIFLPQNLHDLADFEIIAPQAAHILHDDSLYMLRIYMYSLLGPPFSCIQLWQSEAKTKKRQYAQKKQAVLRRFCPIDK